MVALSFFLGTSGIVSVVVALWGLIFSQVESVVDFIA